MNDQRQAAGRNREQRRHRNMLVVIQAGFFDYAAMIAEKGEAGKAAASVKMLKSTLELMGSADGESIDFTKAVLEDILTMIGLAEAETRQWQQNREGKEAGTD